MHIYLRELRSHWKGLLFWSLGMISMVVSGMAKFATYENAGASLSSIIDQFPRAIQVIFGLTGFDLSTTIGYFGVMFFYVALIASTHAVLLGAEIIAKEERDRTTEFLFVKPLTRRAIMASKLLAGLTNLVVLNIITFVSSVLIVNYYSKSSEFVGDVINLMVGLLFLQMLFFGIGVAVAAIRTRPKKSATTATSILLVAFVISFLIDFNADLAPLRYVTPFRYFDAHEILSRGSLDPLYIAISTCVIGLLVATAYRSYRTRDLSL